METTWKLLKNLKINLPYDAATPLLEMYPKLCDSVYYKGTCTTLFIAALFTIAKTWKHPRCPTTEEWNFTQPQRRIIFCHLQENGWNWRTSS
jgi:hypothetical protein